MVEQKPDKPYKVARRIFSDPDFRVGKNFKIEIDTKIRAALLTLVSRNPQVKKQFRTFTDESGKLWLWRKI